MPLQEPIGPNVKKLIISFMTVDAIPPKTGNPFQAGLQYLLDAERVKASAKLAMKRTEDAIYALRHNRVESTYHRSTDEEIAGVILAAIEERKRKP